MTGIAPALSAQNRVGLGAADWPVALLGEAGDVLDSSWLAFGLAAAALISISIICQWITSHRAGRFLLVPWMIYLALTGTILLGVYAWHFQEWVFLLTLMLCLLVGLRLLKGSRDLPAPPSVMIPPKLPVVAPDSAELKLPRKEPPSGIKPTSRISG